jgi:DNA-binding MarR family transcriptional regulator
MAAMTRQQGIAKGGSRRRPHGNLGSTTAARRTDKASARAAPAQVTAPLIPPAGRCNGTAMRRAMRRVSQIYDAALAPCGLRSTQRSILVSIARAGRPTMGELAASLVLDRSALAHNLKPLEREGLVAVVPDDHDKRNRLVALTESGRAKLVESLPLWEEAQRRFERAFGAARAKELRATLDYIASPEFALRLDGKSSARSASETHEKQK